MERVTRTGVVVTACVVTILAVSVAVQATRQRCEWGTFIYSVAVENPTSQEDWRNDIGALVEGEERVVTYDHLAMDAAISPDGKQVVVTKGKGPTDDEYAGVDPVGLYIWDVDGFGIRRLTEGPGGTSLDWSPDGETIAYISDRGIRAVDVEDGDERDVYELPPSDGPNPDYIFDLAWSGDSERIAFFVESQGKGGTDLFTVRTDGSGLHHVLNTESVTDQLAWSPQGDKFAWWGHYKNVPSLMLADASSGKVKQVEPWGSNPVWSKDGSQLAYVISHEGHYAPRIVVGDSNGEGEEAIPKPRKPAGGFTDWASC